MDMPVICACGADLRSIPFAELQKHDNCILANKQTLKVIDGCGIPLVIYENLKRTARESLRTHFIAVHYNPPAIPAKADSFLTFVFTNTFAVQADLMAGRHCSYTVHADRQDVSSTAYMVMWVTPFGD